MADDLKRRVQDLAESLVTWRRALHKRPELGFEEHETAAFVAERLRGLALHVKTGRRQDGGRRRVSERGSRRDRRCCSGPTWTRSRSPKLPAAPTDRRSPGRMHACGHDGHMAMLLGAASVLSAVRDRLDRDVVFCFQPGEEGFGGAEAMIRAGVLVGTRGRGGLRPSLVVAVSRRNRADPVGGRDGGPGRVRRRHGREGPDTARCLTRRSIRSWPRRRRSSPSSRCVARSIDPIQPAVVSVGSLHGGNRRERDSRRATMHGTLRSFDERRARDAAATRPRGSRRDARLPRVAVSNSPCTRGIRRSSTIADRRRARSPACSARRGSGQRRRSRADGRRRGFRLLPADGRRGRSRSSARATSRAASWPRTMRRVRHRRSRPPRSAPSSSPGSRWDPRASSGTPLCSETILVTKADSLFRTKAVPGELWKKKGHQGLRDSISFLQRENG